MNFVSEWRTVLVRSATNWTAAILGALVGALAHTYVAAFAVLPFLPPLLQLPLAVLLGAIVIGGPIILARLTDQPKLQAKIEEHRDAN